MRVKRVLITGGATWVALDRVRVISNLATGETGGVLKAAFERQGCDVTVISGPLELKVFESRLFTALKRKRYDLVIHAAAVSDFAPKRVVDAKVPSDRDSWYLQLFPTRKLIEQIKLAAPSAFLVGFKFEPEAFRDVLVREARALMGRARCDLVVANSAGKRGYRAYVVSPGGVSTVQTSKAAMAKELARQIRSLP